MFKQILFKTFSTIAAIALVITTLNVNTTCTFLTHQEKLPKNAERLRKK